MPSPLLPLTHPTQHLGERHWHRKEHAPTAHDPSPFNTSVEDNGERTTDDVPNVSTPTPHACASPATITRNVHSSHGDNGTPPTASKNASVHHACTPSSATKNTTTDSPPFLQHIPSQHSCPLCPSRTTIVHQSVRPPGKTLTSLNSLACLLPDPFPHPHI